MRMIAVIALAIAVVAPAAAEAQTAEPARATGQAPDVVHVEGAAQTPAPAAGPPQSPGPASAQTAAPGAAAGPAEGPAAGPTPTPDFARADALFRAAQRLRAAGLYVDACPKFAQTQRIVPGIGVSLYLADCYEHLGRWARAWSEFRRAERLALQQKDSRAEVAHARAAALEPKLKRMTIAVSKPIQQNGAEVMLDGASIPPDRWNVALAEDPGDHVLAIRLAGKALRTLHVWIASDAAPLVVPVVDETAAAVRPNAPLAAAPSAPTSTQPPLIAASTPAQTPSPASPSGPVSPGVASPPPAPAGATATASPALATDASGPGTNRSPRSAIELGLLGGGMAAVAIGAGLLVEKNHAMASGEQSSAGAESAVAFGIGAAALVTSVVLYLTAPNDKSGALVVAPVPVACGAGAVLEGKF